MTAIVACTSLSFPTDLCFAPTFHGKQSSAEILSPGPFLFPFRRHSCDILNGVISDLMNTFYMIFEVACTQAYCVENKSDVSLA